jgi:hypothetical protein
MSLILLIKSDYDNPFESLFCKFIMKMAITCYAAQHGCHESVILFISVTCLAEFIMSYLKSQILFMPLYCHILTEASYPGFFIKIIGMDSILVCLSSLLLLSSLYQVSIRFKFQLQ